MFSLLLSHFNEIFPAFTSPLFAFKVLAKPIEVPIIPTVLVTTDKIVEIKAVIAKPPTIFLFLLRSLV